MTRDELLDKITSVCADTTAAQVMTWVDDYVADLTEEPPEAWTAHQVATHVGAKSSAQARAWCSRNGIKSIAFQDHPVSGRQQALYPADRVIEEHNKRRGA